jgi:hypothetical protein
MNYQKPEVVATAAKTGSYVAGCPSDRSGTSGNCKNCERTS